MLTLIQDVAAEVITPRFRALDPDEVDEKNPGDLVTAADREAEELLTRVLRDAHPGAMVLGEEAYAGDASLLDRFAAAEHAFTVDPVDGTKNFVHGSPDHAVMVAELKAGRSVRSWIWQPQHETAYVAELGSGAYRDGVRLRRDPAGQPPSGRTSRRRWIGRRVGDMPPLELSWVCCGVDYPKLVEGETDVLVYGRGNPWDHAPGSLLVTEVGGYVGTTAGAEYVPGAALPPGLVVAADRSTYDHVVAGLSAG